MHRSAHSLTFAVLLASATAAQELVWAEGPAAGPCDVFAVSESNPSAAPRRVLANCELLPLEITNRTAQQALRDDVARRVVRQGLARLVLPSGGSLFRYRRDAGLQWGFLFVDAPGVPSVVLEQPGIGLTGRDDPFVDRLAIAPDGRHALVPSLAGPVTIIRLDGGAFPSTGTAARTITLPAVLELPSHTVGRNAAWFVTDDDRIWRCTLADGNQPVDVTPAGIPGARAKSEFAPSADGRSAAFLYGLRPDFSIYVVGEQGPALRVPMPAAKYEEPGYLPEFVDGPRLLLSDGGDSLLCVDATLRDEAYVCDLNGVLSTTHWTGDPNFQPYIGVIVLPLAINGTFVAGIGDPGRFDVFAAAPGVPATLNLTLTAGNVTRPYGSGGLVPRAIAAFRDRSVLSVFAPSGGGAAQAWQFLPAGPVARALDLRADAVRGASVGAEVAADLLLPSNRGDVLLSGATGDVVLAVPSGVTLSTSSRGPLGAWRVLFAAAAGQRALLFLIEGAGLIGLPANGFDDAVLTRSGALVLGGSSLLLLDVGGAHTIATSAPVRLLLSGQGVDGP